MKNLSVSTTVINLGILNIGFGFQAALWSLKKKKSPLRTLNCSQKNKDENCQNSTTRDGTQIQLTQNSKSSDLTIRAIKHDTEFFLIIPQHLRQAHDNVNWQQVFTNMPAVTAN